MSIKRKIVGYGYSKLICLPSQWLKMKNLQKGDVLEICITENSDLLLKPLEGDYNAKTQ